MTLKSALQRVSVKEEMHPLNLEQQKTVSVVIVHIKVKRHHIIWECM